MYEEKWMSLSYMTEVSMQNETIAAIATAVSNSGISIIRVSGEDAISIVDRCFYTKSHKQFYFRFRKIAPFSRL